MGSEPSGMDVPEPPAGDPAGLPGDDDPTVKELSQTIGTLTVEPDPGMRERIGQLSTTGVSEFIGQFVQKLTTTPSSQIPPQLPPAIDPPVTTTDSTPSTSNQGLVITNVMSLSQRTSITPTKGKPTARKEREEKCPQG